MKHLFSTLAISICMAFGLHAQTYQPDLVIKLWPNGAPTDNGDMEPEKDFGTHYEHTQDPDISVYLPEHPCGLAVLAIPGGGYSGVWYNHEGHLPAAWYNEQGIVYAVLKPKCRSTTCSRPCVFFASTAANGTSRNSVCKVVRLVDILPQLRRPTTPRPMSVLTSRSSSTPSSRSILRSPTIGQAISCWVTNLRRNSSSNTATNCR